MTRMYNINHCFAYISNVDCIYNTSMIKSVNIDINVP